MKNTITALLILTSLVFASCGGLSTKQSKAADDALAELRKLEASTDVGISKSEYSKLLISAQAASKNAVDSLSEGELKDGIKTTMENYADANTLWNIMKDDSYFLACETQPPPVANSIDQRLSDLVCNPEGGELVRKYKITLRDFKTGQLSTTGKGAIKKNEGLSQIWKSAKENLARTTKLYGSK